MFCTRFATAAKLSAVGGTGSQYRAHGLGRIIAVPGPGSARIYWDGAQMKLCYSTTGKRTPLRSTLLAALLVFTTGLVAAQSNSNVELNPAHPDTYVVEKGDTLWDISGMFLKDPWYWPEIWYVNQQVENPHLIYPGDILKLVYIDGQPRIQLQPGKQRGEGRLSPQIREEALDEAITTVSFKDIRPFLAGGMIMDKDEAESLPYVMELRDHLIAGAGNDVYVRGLDDTAAIDDEFLVLRMDDKLRDPETGDVLGYEIVYIANGELRSTGDPSTVFLTKTNREVRRGDRIRPADLSLPMSFFPAAPEQEVNGQIISVVDGVSRIGQYQMVILNRGAEAGLVEGNVLTVWQKGGRVRDTVGGGKVNLPDNKAGHVMIVKAYDRISYALVMEAELEIRVEDRVTSPE